MKFYLIFLFLNNIEIVNSVLYKKQKFLQNLKKGMVILEL